MCHCACQVPDVVFVPWCHCVVCPWTTHHIRRVSDHPTRECIAVPYHACGPVSVGMCGTRVGVCAYEYCPHSPVHPGLVPVTISVCSHHTRAAPWPFSASRHSVKCPLWWPGQQLGARRLFHGFPGGWAAVVALLWAPPVPLARHGQKPVVW